MIRIALNLYLVNCFISTIVMQLTEKRIREESEGNAILESMSEKELTEFNIHAIFTPIVHIYNIYSFGMYLLLTSPIFK